MAKTNPVKCPYCGQSFQREDVEYVQLGRRYAHKACYDTDRQIHDLMQHVLGMNYMESKIESQIKNFVAKDGILVDSIYKTLVYWYQIRKADASQANGGIGIVPYVYADYLTYMQQQQANASINKGKNIKDFIKETKHVVGVATPIKKPRHVKFYELD